MMTILFSGEEPFEQIVNFPHVEIWSSSFREEV